RHPRLPEERERGDEWRGGEDRRIADLPTGGARRRSKLGPHAKAGRGLMPPPAGEAGPVVPRVDETAADRTGPSVQILVAAQDREIRVDVVQRERQVADCVGEVEARNPPGTVRRAGHSAEVECLPGPV